jgi:hypothetical protein
MTPTKQQDEMWVEVLEWMGKHPRKCPCEKPHLIIPPLTLDALHEAEAKLTPKQQDKYTTLLAQKWERRFVYDFETVHASKEQRLLALWRTVNQTARPC